MRQNEAVTYEVDFFGGQVVEVEAYSAEGAVIEALKENDLGDYAKTERGLHFQIWVRTK
jgi:hypothetical protein